MARRRPRIVIAVLLAVLAAALTWKLGCGTSSGDTDELGSNHTSSTTRGTGTRAGAPTSAAPASLSGRVTRASDGTGIPGAVVAIARTELLKELAVDNQPSTVVTTDATGAWTVPTIAPSTYTISATAVGFVPELRSKLVVAAGSRATVDLALAAGGTTISGLVSDVGGGPIGGTRVTVLRAAFIAAPAELVALTGPDGRYQLSLADGGYTAIATHDDYTTASRRFELQGEHLDLDFVLTPGGQIRGQVVSRDGKAVAGAIVSASGGRRDHAQATADDIGNFTLKSLGTGAISVTAAGRGYASATPTIVALGIGEQVDGVRIVVDRAFTIRGRVVRAGKPTEGVADVRLLVFSIANGQTAQAIDPSDDTGAFEIVGVKPASYMMFALGEGVVPEIGKPVDVVDKDVTDLVIEMASGVTLSGRVEPGTLASLSISSTSERIGPGNMFDMIKVALVRGDSDAAGTFTLHAVPSGSFKLVAQTADGRIGTLPISVAAADQTGLVVKLEPRASIAGRVVDANGAPVAGVHVQVSSDVERGGAMTFSDGMGGTVITGANGAFRAVGLEAGKHKVVVADDQGRIPWARGDKRDEPQTFELAKAQALTGVTLAIEARDGVIRGVVVAADGKPVADAWVTARLETKSSGDAMEAMRARFATPAQPILSNSEGKFAIERLRRGSYELIVEGPRGASRGHKAGVKIGETVALVLEPLGTLSGRVTANAVAVAAFDLECDSGDRLEGDGGNRERRFTLGTYALERLVPGDYVCTVTADGGTASGKVTVATGPAQLDLALTPWTSVGGSIVSMFDGKPVAGIAVIASAGDSDGAGFEAMFTGKVPKSDANGRFVVERVAAGKGKLSVMQLDGFGELAKREFTATSGQRVELGAIKIVPPRTGDAGTLGVTLANDDGKLVVASVMPEGPAEQAGVSRADRVVSIDGTPVAELGVEIAQGYVFPGSVAVGQRVQLGLEREGTPLNVSVVAVKW